jgi:hypothetical protein
MFIVNPLTGGIDEAFQHPPPIEERVQRLNDLAREGRKRICSDCECRINQTALKELKAGLCF